MHVNPVYYTYTDIKKETFDMTTSGHLLVNVSPTGFQHQSFMKI